MRSKRMLAAAVAAIAMMAGLPGGAAPAGLGVKFARPTQDHPSVYRWQGVVLQSPHSASDIASPYQTFSRVETATGSANINCASTGGLCEDVPLTVPPGLKTSTLYVRLAWRSPIWKAYLFVTSPDV